MRPAQCRRLRSSGADRAVERLGAAPGRVSRDIALLRAIGGAFGAPRHRHDHRDALFEAVELEAEIRSKLMLQARSRRRDADAFLKRCQRSIGETQTVVADLDPEFVVLLPRANVDVPGTRFFRDTV